LDIPLKKNTRIYESCLKIFSGETNSFLSDLVRKVVNHGVPEDLQEAVMEACKVLDVY
jgi:hypothetical protein